jgi:hypothetical protein
MGWMMDAPISNPPALQNVALFRSTVFTEVINFKVITVVLVQYDWLPYKKGKSGHRHTTDQERMPCNIIDFFDFNECAYYALPFFISRKSLGGFLIASQKRQEMKTLRISTNLHFLSSSELYPWFCEAATRSPGV